eukprot:332742_1
MLVQMATHSAFIAAYVWIMCIIINIRCDAAAPIQPHIIYIAVDDLGNTDLGYHGAEFNTTTLDTLARTGVDLSSYYVLMDCTPTRSSLITGLHPWRFGFQNPSTMPNGLKAHIPFEIPTIAELMKKANYNTQMIGKWHLGFAAKNMTPTGRGFDNYYGYYSGTEDYYYHTFDGGYDLVFDNIPQTGNDINGTYVADLFFDYYNKYLFNTYNVSNGANKPLFMYLSLHTIHAPIEKPPLINMYNQNMTNVYNKECGHIGYKERMIYCQQMQYIDVYIGKLIEIYKQLNMWNNTLLIVTTDNGGMPAWNATKLFNASYATSVGQNYPLRAGKVTLFQGGVLGLAFVSGPLVPESVRGTVNDGLFGCIDWVPSILSFIGYENLIPLQMDGINIFNSLFNNTKFDRSEYIIFSNFDVEEGIVAGSLTEGAIINNNWKYIHGEQLYNCYYPAPPQKPICLTNETINDKYLFNLKNDPYEANNLIEVFPEIA